jgi:hypothetical protein
MAEEATLTERGVRTRERLIQATRVFGEMGFLDTLDALTIRVLGSEERP